MSKHRVFSEGLFSSSNRPITIDDPLPDGWEMLIDPESQFPFFVDHRNHRTSWKDPRRVKALQAFMDSAIGGDNFFKSSFESQNPFFQSRLDPGWGSSQPAGFSRSPMGSPSMQRHSNIRRSTSPQPAGRSTPTLDSQMNRMHAQDAARAFMEGSMPGQQQQVYSSSPRRNDGFSSRQHAPDQGRRAHHEESYSKPERDYSSEGERVYNIPIRVEGRDYLNRPSNSRPGVYQEPGHSREEYARSPPQGIPKSAPGNNYEHDPQRHSRQEYRYQQDQPQSQSEPHQDPQVTPLTNVQQQSSNQDTKSQDVKDSQEKQGQKSPSEKPTTEKKTDGLEERGETKQPTENLKDPPEESKPDPPQIMRIQNILKKILAICQEVEDFHGRRGTKDYLRIEEMLMRQMIELDNIDTMGDERIRGQRRMAVVTAQTLLSRLEKKALPADF
ncbi:BAG family molecular chaperone regulator 3-like [Asterias rubens]|uniref:BAG family molecular chaperone regulator 3-like n=1 Tax=Asterias rubens TaxID=7604 RepID=UPI001454E5D9|nr:BAG family molecular chaperone regulator 3-like [Asterias rubens]